MHLLFNTGQDFFRAGRCFLRGSCEAAHSIRDISTIAGKVTNLIYYLVEVMRGFTNCAGNIAKGLANYRKRYSGLLQDGGRPDVREKDGLSLSLRVRLTPEYYV